VIAENIRGKGLDQYLPEILNRFFNENKKRLSFISAETFLYFVVKRN
jgi:hypothetical protein